MELRAPLHAGRECTLVLRTADDFARQDCCDNSRSPSPDWTLSQFFQRYFLPVHLQAKQAKQGTIAEYRSAMSRWCEITGDPPLGIIDNITCARFVETDLVYESEKHKGQPISPNTVRKHCTHLQMVLELAGPPTREHPEAASQYGLFGEDPWGRPRAMPWFTKPPARDKLPTDGFTLEEIELLLASCGRATAPVIHGCSAAHWWRCLLLFDYNTGLRIGSLIELRRSWVTRAGDEGWATIPGDAYKGSRPKVIYLSPEACKTLDAMPTGDRVFPWTMTTQTLQRHRKRLLRIAGISEERWFGFHGIRKATGTQIWKIKPDAAQRQLGHEDQATTRKSYVNPDVLGAAIVAQMGQVMRQLPQPRLPSRV